MIAILKDIIFAFKELWINSNTKLKKIILFISSLIIIGSGCLVYTKHICFSKESGLEIPCKKCCVRIDTTGEVIQNNSKYELYSILDTYIDSLNDLSKSENHEIDIDKRLFKARLSRIQIHNEYDSIKTLNEKQRIELINKISILKN